MFDVRRLTQLTDAELLARTRRDPEAFGVFYERHSRMVMGLLVSATGETERALDLTAEVFAAALAGASRFKNDGPPASAWLVGIARNKLAVARRGDARAYAARQKLGIPRLSFDDEELERVEAILDACRGEYERALMKLPAAQRNAINARVLDEMDYAEIAKTQRTSQAAIRQRVSRGLAKLARPARGGGQ
jgi:RNA polymerase sigma factor (sigma-70 family)